LPSKTQSKFPPIGELVTSSSQLPHMFEITGVKPGVRTLSRLVEAAFADKTVVLTIFSTLALDLQDQPLELAIAKFRAIMAKAEESSAFEQSLLASLEKMTLASARVIDFDAVKIINDRLKHIRTNPIGQCRVYVRPQSLNAWTFKLDVQDQRKRGYSPSHSMVLYGQGIQLIGPHGSLV